MKRTVIASVSDLPQAFRVENYSAAPALTLADWTANFSFRTLRRSALASWREQDGTWPNARYREQMELAVTYLWRNPLLPSAVVGAYASKSMDKFIESRQVRDQSAMEGLQGIWEIGDDARMKRYTDAMRLTNLPVDSSPGGEARYNDAHTLLWKTPMWRAQEESRIDDDKTVAATVNLQAPEDQLVEDFRSWLREIKAARSLSVPRKAVTPADMQRWAEFKILPYLDLTFWADLKGFEFTQQALGLALFPGEYDVNLAERIRNTVIPIANRISTYDHCNYMVVQVLKEQAETGRIVMLPDDQRGPLDPSARHPLP